VSTGQEPHVSDALKHLRHGVTGAGVVFALALICHLFIWGFVHFTDVRVHRLEANAYEKPLLVVESQGGDAPVANDRGDAVDVNTVPSTGSVMLQRSAHVVQTIGVIAAIALALLTFQGVIIAGGGAVPGVEMAVTAASWSLVITLLALPWNAVLPTFAFHGVFQPYETIVVSSDMLRAGATVSSPLAYYAMNVALPLILLGGVSAAVIRFRMGVERGVIATHASQLDEKIEREIRARKLGELATPRAVGALNQAIGMPAAKPAPGAPAAPDPGLPVEPAPEGPPRPPMQQTRAAPDPGQPAPPKRPI